MLIDTSDYLPIDPDWLYKWSPLIYPRPNFITPLGVHIVETIKEPILYSITYPIQDQNKILRYTLPGKIFPSTVK